LLSLELPGFLAILNSYSILAFQFDIHPVLLTLQIDMKHKSQVSWAALIGIASESFNLFDSRVIIMLAFSFSNLQRSHFWIHNCRLQIRIDDSE